MVTFYGIMQNYKNEPRRQGRMRLKLRMGDERQHSKTEIDLVVREIRVRENKINTQDETIEICFKEGAASGILEMRRDELSLLNDKVRDAARTVRRAREE